jgi:uncharacterized protein YjiS (DUF1127 family)
MTAIVDIRLHTGALRRASAYEMHHHARTRRARLLARVLMRAMRAVSAFMALAYRSHRQRAEARATYDALRMLDDRMLHDIGFERSEIMSVATEATGVSERTRAQAMWHGLP